MAYAHNFLRLTMNGEVANGADIWSAGLHIAGFSSTDTDSLFEDLKTPGAMTALADIVADFIATPAAMVPAGVTLESIKVAHLDTAGKYIEAALEEEKFAQGNVNAAYVPQAAIVNTLVADKFKDPGKYNRFYLPVAMDGTADVWCLTPAQQAAYAAATANFLGEINDYLSSIHTENPVFVSVLSNSGTGHFAAVQWVRIGRVVDTQRRRRNKIPELYVTEPVVSI